MNLPTHNQHQPLVLRQVAFTVPTFDYLKRWQRDYSGKHGVWLDNSKALAVILDEHRQAHEQAAEEEALQVAFRSRRNG